MDEEAANGLSHSTTTEEVGKESGLSEGAGGVAENVIDVLSTEYLLDVMPESSLS